MCLEDTCAFSSTQNGRYLERNADRHISISLLWIKTKERFAEWRDFVDLTE